MNSDTSWLVPGGEDNLHHMNDGNDVVSVNNANNANNVNNVNSANDVNNVNSVNSANDANSVNQFVASANRSFLDSFNNEENSITPDERTFPGQSVDNDAGNSGEELPQNSQVSTERAKLAIPDLPLTENKGFWGYLKAGKFSTALSCCGVPSSSTILEEAERSFSKKKEPEEKKVVTSSIIQVKSVDDLLAENTTLNGTVCLVDTPKGKVMVLKPTSEGYSSSIDELPDLTKKQSLEACFVVTSSKDVMILCANKKLAFSKDSSRSLYKSWKISANSVIDMKEAGPLNAKNPFFAVAENDSFDFDSKFFPPLVGQRPLAVYALTGVDYTSLTRMTSQTNPRLLPSRQSPLPSGGSVASLGSVRNLGNTTSFTSSTGSKASSGRRLVVVARRFLPTLADVVTFIKGKKGYKEGTNNFLQRFVDNLETDFQFATSFMYDKNELTLHLTSLRDSLFQNFSTSRQHVPGLSKRILSLLPQTAQYLGYPFSCPDFLKIEAMLKESEKLTARYRDVYGSIARKRSKFLTEKSISKFLNDALVSAKKVGIGINTPIDVTRSLQLQTWFPTLIGIPAQIKELEYLKKIFKLKSHNDPTLDIFVNGIAKSLEDSTFSQEAFATSMGFIAFLIHDNIEELDFDHLTMELFHSAIRINPIGRYRGDGSSDIKMAIRISKAFNIARGGSANTVLPVALNNEANNVFISGIRFYLNLVMIYSLLDDAAIVGLMEQHQPCRNGRDKEVDNYITKIKQGLLNYKYSNTLSTKNINDIHSWISSSKVDFTLDQLQALLISVRNGCVQETQILHDLHVKPLNIPIEAECAYYFLKIRMDHFTIKCKDIDFLDKETPQNIKDQNLNKQEVSEAKELIEDVFKQINATIAFMKECNPSGDYTKVESDLRDSAHDIIMTTLHEMKCTSASFKDTVFASSFTSDAAFLKWMEDTKNLTTLPRAINTEFRWALGTNVFYKKAFLGSILNDYIQMQELARSDTAK